jgi:hypothetical protein
MDDGDHSSRRERETVAAQRNNTPADIRGHYGWRRNNKLVAAALGPSLPPLQNPPMVSAPSATDSALVGQFLRGGPFEHVVPCRYGFTALLVWLSVRGVRTSIVVLADRHDFRSEGSGVA